MNILITGIQGFVGSNLVRALKSDNIIYGLDIINSEKDGVIRTFSWNELDTIPEVDIVIHLAGKAHDMKNQSETQEYFEINTELTKKIYDWFLFSNAKKFIFFSSVKAAADYLRDKVLTEDIIPNPKGPYGESKIAAENYILSKTNEANLKEKFTYIFRPCMIHGPGNKGNLNLLYNVIKKGFPWPLGAFDNKRSFTSIDNLSYIVSNTISSDINSGIYNIGDDNPVSTNELITILCEVLDKKSLIWRINPKIMKFCAKIGSLFHLPLNSERLQKLTEDYVVSNKKIKEALKIENLPISSRDGLMITIRSFQNS